MRSPLLDCSFDDKCLGDGAACLAFGGTSPFGKQTHWHPGICLKTGDDERGRLMMKGVDDRTPARQVSAQTGDPGQARTPKAILFLGGCIPSK